MSKKTKSDVQKVIFQARYNPQITFHNILHVAAQELTETYQDWETDGLRATLKDFNNHCSVQIGHDSFTYEQDFDSEQLEVERIDEIVEKLPKSLQIKVFRRLGYRKILLHPVKMDFASLVKVMEVKLLTQDPSLKDSLPPVKDLMYRVDLSEPPLDYHLTVGPLRKNEISRHVSPNLQNNYAPSGYNQAKAMTNIVDAYPEVAIVIDIDVFMVGEALELSKTEGFLKDARHKVQTLSSTISDYLLE